MNLVRYHYERSNLNETWPLLDLTEEIYKAQEVDRHEKLSIIYSLRTAIERWRNNGEAALLHAEAALRAQIKFRAQSGVDTMELSYAYYNLGLAYKLCRLPSKAIIYMDKTMEIRQNLPGYKPLDLYGPLHQCGLALLQQGDVRGCEHGALEAKRVWEEVKGTNDLASFRCVSVELPVPCKQY